MRFLTRPNEYHGYQNNIGIVINADTDDCPERSRTGTCGAPVPTHGINPGVLAQLGVANNYRQSSLACINPWFITDSNDGCFLI